MTILWLSSNTTSSSVSSSLWTHFVMQLHSHRSYLNVFNPHQPASEMACWHWGVDVPPVTGCNDTSRHGYHHPSQSTRDKLPILEKLSFESCNTKLVVSYWMVSIISFANISTYNAGIVAVGILKMSPSSRLQPGGK